MHACYLRTIGAFCGIVVAMIAPLPADAIGLVIQPTVSGQLIRGFVSSRIIAQALIAFWGLAATAVFYYGARLVLDSYKEQSLSEANTSFINLLIGFAVIACSAAIASALSTQGLSSDTVADVDPALVATALDSVRQFIISLTSAIFVLVIVIAAFRMTLSNGDQGEFDKWKKIIIGCVTGVMIMLIADAIVLAVSERDALIIITELKGIALFLLTIAGFLCVLAIIVAGVLLIVSIDESLRDRAKTAITGTLIALGIVICSYAIISTFLPDTSITPHIP